MAKISTPSHPEDHHERHLYSTGGDALLGEALGAPVIIRFTLDQTINSSTTLRNDDYFTIPMAANAEYAFTAMFKLTTSLSTQWKWLFTGPTSFTGGRIELPQTNVVNMATLAYEGSSGIARSNVGFMMFGNAQTGGTSGDLQFQWAPRYSHADDVTVHKGSWVSWTRIV